MSRQFQAERSIQLPLLQPAEARPVYGHGLVFLGTGFHDPSLLAVRVDGRRDITTTHVAWALER